MSGAFVAVLRADELPEKKIHCAVVDGTAVALCRVRGEFFAVENRCSHALATFDEGRMRAYRIMCPLHGGTFDVRSGAPTGEPAKTPIRTFPTRVSDDGHVEVMVDSPADG